MFDIEGTLAHTDLLEYVQRAGGKPRKMGSEYRCACPLHGGHNPTGFAVYKSNGKQVWKCFSGDCGSGDVYDFIGRWQNLPNFTDQCKFLDAKTIFDPVEMARLAAERAERAKKELDEAIAKANAARAELQAAELHLAYHNNLNCETRKLWISRGIDESWQDFWYLGYRSDYTFMTPDGEWHSPTLTIPLFDTARQLLNIKHRLLKPAKPNDKYRPERSGLGAMPPFLAIPEQGWEGDYIIVTEGEIKAMVLCTLDLPQWQFVGVPGRSAYKHITNNLKGKRAIFIPDPGAEQEAIDAAKECGGRVLTMPQKVDDYVIEHSLAADWLRDAVKSGRLAR